MKVVVSGGAGFIGSHCVDALVARGHDVTVIDDLSSGREKNLAQAKIEAKKRKLKFKLIKASISDPKLWAKLPAHDAFFHFAAQTSVTASVENPTLDFKSNVTPVRLIIDWLRKKKVHYFFYANTAGALYGEAESFPTDERSSILPLAPYGATKAFFETYLFALTRSLKALKTWSDDPRAENYFTWASLRLGNVYGPRQTTKGEAGVVPIFFNELQAGRIPIIYGDGSKKRDYVYVSDVIEAFMAAFDKAQACSLDDFYNIASGVETPDIVVFDTVVDTLKARHVKDARFAPVRAWEVIRSSLNIYKAKAYFAWAPKVDFQEGVQKTIEWNLEQKR